VPIEARVEERRRAAALARHYRDVEGLSITEIAGRLGRSPATVKAYLYDPTGAKARAVKARYRGICRGCGNPTQPRNGKGDAYEYCKTCRPGAIAARWTRDRVRHAMLTWYERFGKLPTSYEWSRTHAQRRGAHAFGRLRRGERHRGHASHLMPSGILDSIGTTDWCWGCCATVSRVWGREELRQAKARRGGPFGTP
jgi:hypothetical protein